MLNSKGMTLISGAELPDGTVVLATNEPDLDPIAQPHTAVAFRDGEGEWHPGGLFTRPTASVCLNAPGNKVLLTDPNGAVAEFRPGDGTRFELRPKDPRYRGRVLRFIRNIGGTLIAGGAGHTVHMAEPGQPWTEVTTPEMEQTPNPRGFEDAAGFGQGEIYCVGWGGAIWSRIDGTWSEIQSPTNLLLSCAGVSSEKVYAGGKMGIVLEGRGTDWRVLEHDVTDQQLFDIATFQGTTYFSGFFGVMRLRDGELALEWATNPEIRTAGTLFVGPSGLWSVGSSTLALFDGSEWRTILQT